MISHFFIDRPIFAAVLSIVIVLAGLLALLWLPLAQYPEITPPSVSVAITYPGASAQVVADTVAAPIEEQVNGVPGMLYMSSQSGNDGSYSLSVTFEVGTNLNTALVMVQNRVTLAMPQLPTEVQRQGITIRKRTPDILLVANVFSPGGRYDDLYLSNYATSYLRDELLRVDGVSDINIFGERDYSIRAWLHPQKMAAAGITAMDVADAIRTQNVEAAPGQIGQPPAPRGQSLQVPVDTLGRLNDPEQFGEIVVKVGRGGAMQSGAEAGATASGSTATTPTSGPPGTISSLSVPIGNGPASGGAGTGSTTTGTSATGSTGSTGTTGDTSGGTSGGTSGTGSTGSYTTGSGTSTNGTTGATNGPATGNATSVVPVGGSTGVIPTGTTSSTAPAARVEYDLPEAQSPSVVRLRDVARIERAAKSYSNASTFDRRPAVGLAIHQLPGTNALDVANRVRQKMEELKQRFPDGVDYDIAYDTTPFIRESVTDVAYTLLEAVVLVAAVVLVFLQSWRATLIPLVAVPVAIIGTFAVMAGLSAVGARYNLPALNFSLNNISLFGLVLAIGIVVDDAIVVVENVERWLEKGEQPREAARKAMDEVTGPVIAVALVLCAVFVPCAFIGGITGQFFRQFAVTIAASTLFSMLNSLTLSPALAALLLKPRGGTRDPLTWLLDVTLGWFFRLFNWGFGAGVSGYSRAVGGLVRISVVVLLVYGGLMFLTVWVFKTAPTGFVPEQDQGRVIVNVQLPDSASLERTSETLALAEQIAHDTPGVAHTVTVAGMSLVGSVNSSNFGTVFIILDPFDKRRRPELKADAIMARLRREYGRQIKDGIATVFGAPPIPGLSVASGFRLMVEDRGGLGLGPLQQQTDALVGKLNRTPQLVGVQTQFRSNVPQLYLDVDRTKVAMLGVTLNDVNQTMQIFLGSLYVNNYNEFGRDWQVTLQAEGRYRTRPSDVNLLAVRNNQGQVVPLGTLVNLREITGPVSVTRYNLYVAAPITGVVRPGVSSGDAIATVDRLAEQSLPRSMGTEWTELMFLQIRAGNTAFYVFLLAVLLAFLVLAALYESWSLPLAVILVVPMCLLCSIGGVLLFSGAVDIFVQIGLIVLVGLACKNSILIVEFAHGLRLMGKSRLEATVEASRLRVRPILMTSLAFILGVLPLVLASGAGAEMRRSLGTAVFSGMLGVTLFGIFLTPVFFAVVQWASETRLLAAAATRWTGSAVLGALLGLTVTYLLREIGVPLRPWVLAAGACVGTLLGLLLPVFQQVRGVVGGRPLGASGDHYPEEGRWDQ
jgi:multidrug efflux pump